MSLRLTSLRQKSNREKATGRKQVRWQQPNTRGMWQKQRRTVWAPCWNKHRATTAIALMHQWIQTLVFRRSQLKRSQRCGPVPVVPVLRSVRLLHHYNVPQSTGWWASAERPQTKQTSGSAPIALEISASNCVSDAVTPKTGRINEYSAAKSPWATPDQYFVLWLDASF